jgi:hypothetical protein
MQAFFWHEARLILFSFNPAAKVKPTSGRTYTERGFWGCQKMPLRTITPGCSTSL